jgi:hypothetical protein
LLFPLATIPPARIHHRNYGSKPPVESTWQYSIRGWNMFRVQLQLKNWSFQGFQRGNFGPLWPGFGFQTPDQSGKPSVWCSFLGQSGHFFANQQPMFFVCLKYAVCYLMRYSLAVRLLLRTLFV